MEHPIEGLINTAMSNIKTMIDVNTIIGEPVTTPDGSVIIPVSTVSYGFGAGGGEFASKSTQSDTDSPLFGGGCGGGAKIKPVAFLVVSNGNIRLLPVDGSSTPIDKIIDLVPDMVDKVNNTVSSLGEKIFKHKKKESNDFVDVVDNTEE